MGGSLAPIFLLLPANATAISPNTLPSRVAKLPDGISSVVAGAGGIFIEDYNNGSLYHWDKLHHLTLVTTSPRPLPSGYVGMAVEKTLSGLQVALSEIEGGLYYCDGVTALGVASCSSFIDESSFVYSFSGILYQFCPTRRACYIEDIAFDSSGNLFYVDPVNDIEVELTASSGYTYATVTQSFPPGNEPSSLWIDANGVHWVGDGSCTGNVFHDGILLGAAGGEVLAITESNKNPYHANHIYIAVSPVCSGGNYTASPAYVLDLYEGFLSPPLPSQSLGATFIFGLSSNLYFSVGLDVRPYNAVYKTADTY